MKKKKRELIDLWLSVAIMLVMVVYHVGANVIGGWSNVLSEDAAGLLSHGIFVWLMGMMWIAYQRWRSTARHESVLDDVISSTGLEVIMVVDGNDQITMCNEAIFKVYGYQVDEVVGRPSEMLFGDRRAHPEREDEVQVALDEYGFHRGEARGTTKAGDPIVVEVATAPRKKGDGLVLMVQDITERKLYEQRLREAKEVAESANEAKEVALQKLEASYQRLRELEIHRDNLIHMVCHDMKAPLQVLILQLDILKEMIIEKLDNDELGAVDALLAYSRQLEVMVHSMLDLSKLEAGSMPIKLRNGDLVTCLKNGMQFIGTMGNGVTMELNAPEELRGMTFDPDILQRILVNLLFNAMKYSPPDGVITLSLNEEDVYTRIKVTDQGPGIPAEYHGKIFEKFGQVKEEGHTRSGSTGLGLTFCKMAVEAHGGQIGVESVEGQGSTFWFTLPREASLIPKAPKTQLVKAD